jgi:hypothetical protein
LSAQKRRENSDASNSDISLPPKKYKKRQQKASAQNTQTTAPNNFEQRIGAASQTNEQLHQVENIAERTQDSDNSRLQTLITMALKDTQFMAATRTNTSVIIPNNRSSMNPITSSTQAIQTVPTLSISTPIIPHEQLVAAPRRTYKKRDKNAKNAKNFWINKKERTKLFRIFLHNDLIILITEYCQEQELSVSQTQRQFYQLH